MIIPPYLKPGSKIRIVSPAGKIERKHVMPVVEWLEKQGYTIVLGDHVFSEYFQFAGTDQQRLNDLQKALDDAEADVILCSRGGYGTVRIINCLDFTKFLTNPKWLVGFSDITILHSCLNNLRVATIHGVMPRYFFDSEGNPSEDLKSLSRLIQGEQISYTIAGTEFNRTGNATAELVGGNLSIVSSLTGTAYDLDTKGKILFLEDIDEFLYHTDRMIHQLKLGGKLDHLAGLILGDFTDMKDNESPFGSTVHEIILDAVNDFNYPVCFGFPAGHDKKNLALAFGKIVKLNIQPDKIALDFQP